MKHLQNLTQCLNCQKPTHIKGSHLANIVFQSGQFERTWSVPKWSHLVWDHNQPLNSQCTSQCDQYRKTRACSDEAFSQAYRHTTHEAMPGSEKPGLAGNCPWPWQGGWNWMICKVPSNPSHSQIWGNLQPAPCPTSAWSLLSDFQCLHGQCPEITPIFNVSSWNFAAEIDCAMKIYNGKQYSIIQNLGTNILENKANPCPLILLLYIISH